MLEKITWEDANLFDYISEIEYLYVPEIDDYQYLIKGGQLLIREIGKTSWADSRFDDVRVADIEQTRRFLRDVLHLLKKDNL